MTLNLSPKTKLRTLWVRMLILLKAKIFLCFDTYRLQIAEDGSSELPQRCSSSLT